MRNRLSAWVLTGLLIGLLGCGSSADTTCSAQVTIEHDLSSMFDDDCNFDSCMGEDGSDFRIMLAPISQTVSNSTCALMPDGQASDTATVERAGEVLTISINFEDLTLSLSGNSLSSATQEFGDGICQNSMSNIQGALDYNTKTLAWSYDLTVTDLGGCFQ